MRKKIDTLLKIINKYEINTLEYENHIIALLASVLCFSGAIINFVFFVSIAHRDASEVARDSIIFVVFGVLYIICDYIPLAPKKIELCLNITVAVMLAVYILLLYRVIGPTVWTISFLVILVSLLRENLRTMVLISIVLFLLGSYIWYFKIDYILNDYYYCSQFIIFSMLFIVSEIVFFNNKQKNQKIESQFKDLEKLTADIKNANDLLEDEIKEHLNVNMALLESENKFKTIVNSFPDVVFILSADGRFIDCDGGDTSLLLYKKEEYTGKFIGDVMPQDIANMSYEKIKLTIENNDLNILEYKLSINGSDDFFEVRFAKMNENKVMAVLRKITEEKNKLLMIEKLSFSDQLTGLHNRRFFDEEIINVDKIENLPISIAIIDVNGLKMVNDAFGHSAGDKLLVAVANVLKKECGDGNAVSRIGGDEFVLLLPNTTTDDMEIITKRIYKAVSAITEINTLVSVSLGWDTKIQMDESIDQVYKKAEDEMYSKKMSESQSVRNRTIQVILKTLNEKSTREKVHSENVSFLCSIIGRAMGFDEESLKEIEIAGLMHDIGKISVPESVLNKPARLTDSEYEEIKKHPGSSYQILRSADAYINLAEYVLCHHERWDGKGYPRGLSKDEIPLYSRIIAVADAFEAMTTDRTYRKAMKNKDAFEELRRCAGTQFDPKIVEILINALKDD